MSKVLLINPTFKRDEQYGALNKMVSRGVPLSLGYLAGYLLDKGVEVEIVDEQWTCLTDQKLEEFLETFQPDIAGISSLTPVIYRSFEIAEKIKELSPHVLVVFGNVHPTVLPEESLNKKYVDIVVRGEGEESLWECVQMKRGNKNLSDILGISYKVHGQIIHNPDRPYIRDLDTLPPFAHELIRKATGAVSGTILTSRGCPFHCIFCSSRSITGYKYRTHSAQRVLADVEHLVDKYRLREIYIADDNFLVSRKRAEEICNHFIARGLHQKLRWACQTRGDAVDLPILKLMKEAGCYMISFGIETGSPRLLESIKKSEKIADNVRALKLAREAGIETRGAFILGLPGETGKESFQTIRFAKSLPLDYAKFALATPYPGTELYEIAKQEGTDFSDDWTRLSVMAGISKFDPLYIPQGRTARELKFLQLWAHLEFYLRPRQIFAILKGRNPQIMVKSYKDIMNYFTAVIKMLSRFLAGRQRREA